MLAGAGQDEDLVAGSASGERRSGGQKIVGISAVGDGRRLLGETEAVSAGVTRGDRAAHVAAGPDLGGDRSDQPLLGGEAAQIDP